MAYSLVHALAAKEEETGLGKGAFGSAQAVCSAERSLGHSSWQSTGALPPVLSRQLGLVWLCPGHLLALKSFFRALSDYVWLFGVLFPFFRAMSQIFALASFSGQFLKDF